MRTSSDLLWAALAIGVVTGMRSMLAPTLVSRALARRHAPAALDEPARTLASPRTRHLLMPLAAGELLGDKLPFAPDRTIPPSMAFRAVSGAVSAAALAGASRQPVLLPAVIGAAAACVAARVGLGLRQRYRTSALSNAALGLTEDSLAFAIGNAGLHLALGRAEGALPARLAFAGQS